MVNSAFFKSLAPNESRSMIIRLSRLRCFLLTLSAAGFIATKTSARSPGALTLLGPICTWKPDTPLRDPCGARISAGKSGNVEIVFPSIALKSVKMVPVSCIPSPESPEKRMTTSLLSLTVVCPSISVITIAALRAY